MKLIIVGLAMVLAGCASNGQRAPVVERGATSKTQVAKVVPESTKDWRPRVHVVQKGDTLYAIAFNYGLDARELAEQNNIQDPNLIQVGQQINLFPSQSKTDARPVMIKDVARDTVKDQPRLVKYAYSDAAVAKAQSEGAKSDAKPEVKPDAKTDVKADVKPDSRVDPAAAEDAIEWSMPAQGKLIAGFSEAENRKGIDIAGKLGQPIFASAPGKVVYSGSGLRGYGKLLIIKHNKTYLSAYAHNDQLLVKEGETVTRGQKIAEMGSTDSDQVKLHFEVRRLGKPVDPAGYLPLNKS